MSQHADECAQILELLERCDPLVGSVDAGNGTLSDGVTAGGTAAPEFPGTGDPTEFAATGLDSTGLDEIACRRLERHLDRCAECRLLVTGEGEDWSAVLPPIPMPSDRQWQELDEAVLGRHFRPVGATGPAAPYVAEPRTDSTTRASSARVSVVDTGRARARLGWQSRALAAAALLLCCLLGLQAIRSPENDDAMSEAMSEFAFEFESAVEVIDTPEDVDVIVQTFTEESDGAIVIFVSG